MTRSVLLLLLPACHAAPTSITSRSVRDAQAIAEAAGVAPSMEVYALLREVIRPYVTTEALDVFESRLARRRLGSEQLNVHTAHVQATPARDRAGVDRAGVDRAGVDRALTVRQASTMLYYDPDWDTPDVIKSQYLSSWIDEQQWHSFVSSAPRADGQPATIHYVVASGSGSRGAVVVSVGNGEPAEKYSEQMVDLLDAGFSPVYVMDHRGQGRSSRLLDDTFKSHVEEWDHFVADFSSFVGIVVAAEPASRLYLHCHSMGCAVAFSYLIQEYEAQRPNLFHAVAASSPLIQPNTDPFPYQVAVAIGDLMLLLGLGDEYPPTRGYTLEANYTVDPSASLRQQRFYEHCHAKRDAPYAAGHTGLCVGDPTARFAAEFFGTYDTFNAFKETTGKLSVPILLQQAKTNEDGHDGTVMNAPQAEFCSSSCDRCTLTKYPTSAHNIWFERDSIRSAALEEVFEFYGAHAAELLPQNPLPPPACGWYQFWCAWSSCDCVW